MRVVHVSYYQLLAGGGRELMRFDTEAEACRTIDALSPLREMGADDVAALVEEVRSSAA